MRAVRSSWLSSGLCAAVVLVCAGPAATSAAAQTTCSFDSTTNVLLVDGDPIRGSLLSVDGSGEIDVWHLSTSGSAVMDCTGPTPTTLNTDSIDVQHTSPNRDLTVIVSNPQEFAPGATDEGGVLCTDEIEIDVSLGGGEDTLRLQDTVGVDSNVELGVAAVDWNPTAFEVCADPDIESFSLVDYRIDGAAGQDEVSSLGGLGAGSPAVTSIEFNGDAGNDVAIGGQSSDDLDGGDGDDVLRGGDGQLDYLTGGPGRDKLFGEAGLDGLFAEDGEADRKIECGPGANVNEFAVFDSRKDPKPQSC